MEEAQYIVTFIVMFLVALVISHLANRLRQQAQVARLQERQATAMHGLSRQLAGTRGTEKIFQVAVQYISEIFDGQCMAMVPNGQGKLKVTAGDPSSVLHQDIVKEIQIAHAAYNTGQMTGLGTQTSQTSENLYVPIRAGDFTMGVLVLRPADRDRFRQPGSIESFGILGQTSGPFIRGGTLNWNGEILGLINKRGKLKGRTLDFEL